MSLPAFLTTVIRCIPPRLAGFSATSAAAPPPPVPPNLGPVIGVFSQDVPATDLSMKLQYASECPELALRADIIAAE